MSAPRILSKATLPIGKTVRRRGPRTEVLTDKLCDDILSYVGPLLAKHKGCDILDGNPGAGLWSSKIHEFLKPRRHVLIEEDEAYMPLLRPYLDAPGSTYVHAPYDGGRPAGFARTLDEGYLPDQQALSKDDPRLNQPNNTLLVMANLTRSYISSKVNSELYKRHNVHALTTAAFTHSLFHQYGLIRMLLWVDEGVKDAMIPRSLAMNAYTMGFNWAANANIVADTSPDRLGRGSPDAGGVDVDFASAVQTARKMQWSGMKLPPGRSWEYHEKAWEMSTRLEHSEQPESLHHLLPEVTTRDTLAKDELQELELAYASGNLGRFLGQPTNGGSVQPRNIDPRFIRMLYLQKMEKFYQARRSRGSKPNEKYIAHLRLTRRMFETDFRLRSGKASNEEYMAATKAMHQMGEDCIAIEKSSMIPSSARMFRLARDNRNAYYVDPPFLMWDRRQYEPLKILKDELRATDGAALLDVQPKPPSRTITADELAYWKKFVELLYTRPSSTIKAALEHMAAGSSEVVLERVPSLSDLSRGGSLNPGMLSVRALSPELLDDVVQAYRSWIFRPDHVEKKLITKDLDWDDLIFTMAGVELPRRS
ncbi:S-adenosyl-L-methionine-dependent methyltransferase [Saccharata proteae CBS 121410]|uniref:Mitochondrial transcription factor 1 n=1 Tax=Saccharata proteae CBS 121410 TaxID=1314787 RepID=A0A9P4LUU8_9PEZI|nr:S-adenosyl-L-methionine-dependent methyltransferase [Saccharata proteae CBS 121410]